MTDARDIARVKRNVAKLIGAGVSKTDLDTYVASEGMTADMLRKAGRAPIRPTPPPYDRTSSLGDLTRDLAFGVNRGFIGASGIPGGAIEAGARTFGSEQPEALTPMASGAAAVANLIGRLNPFPSPTEQLETARSLGIKTRGPERDFAGRTLGRIGEFIGSGGFIPGARALGAGQLLRPAVEAVTLGSAALGGQAVEEMGGGPAAQLAGELVGGIAPLTTPTAIAARLLAKPVKTIAGGGADVMRGFRGRPSPALSAAARERVAADLGKEITPQGASEIANARLLKQNIPGFEPTLGQASGLPSIARREEAVMSGASGRFLNEVTEQRERSHQAIVNALGDQAPEGVIDDLTDVAQDRVTRALGGVSAEESRLATRAMATVLGRRPPIESGAAIRAALEKAKTAAMAVYDRMKAEIGDTPLPYGDLRDNTKAVIAETAQAIREQATSGVVRGLAVRAKPAGEAPTIGFRPGGFVAPKTPPDTILTSELLDVRRELNRQLRLSNASPVADQARRTALYDAKKAVDDLIDKLPPEQRELFDAANAHYRDFVAPTFRRETTGKVLKRAVTGGYATTDEQAAMAFFRPDASNGVSAARQFKAALGENPTAMAELDAAVMDSLHTAAARNGVVDPKRLTEWMRTHARTLDEFPEIKTKIASLQASVDAIAQRQAQLVARRRGIEDSVLAGLAGKPVAQAIREALADPKRMLTLRATVRNSPDGQRALARGVWDVLGPQVTDKPTALLAYLESKGSGLPLSGDHRTALRDIARAAEMESRSRMPRGISGAMNPDEVMRERTGFTMATAINTLWQGMVIRMTSPRSAALRLGSLVANRQFSAQSDALWREALTNPQAAEDLMTLVTVSRAGKPLERSVFDRLRGYQIGAGVSYFAEEE